MMLFNKSLKPCLALASMTLCLAASAATTTSAAPIYLGIYPENIEVSYQASGQAFTLQYYVVNTSSSSLPLSNFALAPVSSGANPVTVTGYSTDCNGVLPASGPSGVCNIYVNITANNIAPSAPIAYDLEFSYGLRGATYTSEPFELSFASGDLIPSASRTFTFVNNCDQDIWFGIDSGAAPAITPDPSIQPLDPASCVSNNDCYHGSTCVAVTSTLNHCMWNNPAPTNADFKLPKYDEVHQTASTNTVVFPAYDNGIGIVWNGGIAARTQCDQGEGLPCKIADCGADPAGSACPVPSGFLAPATLAEFSLLTFNPVVTNTSGYTAGDTYDITIINGVTIPTTMKPTSVAWGGPSKPYLCGEAGSFEPSAPLSACKWFDKPAYSDDFVWVDTDGGESCGSCDTGHVCGHTITGSVVGPLTCGTQLGYLTADAVCAIDDDFGAPFNCSTQVLQNGTEYTLTDIYGCSTGDFGNSCYSAGASAACCGCQDWNVLFPGLVPSTTQTCNASNSYWQQYLIGTASNLFSPLPWLKELCPTAYVYPFDDASSTFGCQQNDDNNNNVVNYTVTFCAALEPA